MPVQPPSVVVGVDGTHAARTAALWAAAEAAARQVPLRLVYAYTPPPVFYPWALQDDGAMDRTARAGAERMLDELAAEIRAGHHALVVPRVRSGHPVDVLREESEAAVLTVVGAHGSHQFAEALLGTVAARIAGRAAGPLAVVRSAGPDSPPRSTGPVVVGVDHPPYDDAALAFAFDAAQRRDAPLIAVHCWNDQALHQASAWIPFTVAVEGLGALAAQRLQEQVAPWRASYPDVSVSEVVCTRQPAATLLGYADDAATDPARLLVVGRRGSGGFRRLLLGSVSSSLIAYADCPVVVVNDRVPVAHPTVEPVAPDGGRHTP